MAMPKLPKLTIAKTAKIAKIELKKFVEIVFRIKILISQNSIRFLQF